MVTDADLIFRNHVMSQNNSEYILENVYGLTTE